MVSVIVRLRPLRQHEEGEVVRYQLPKGISVCTHPEKQQFEAFDDFDRVFTEQATQQDIYQEVRHVVQAVMNGTNGTIMTYGQTAAGKSHTLLGNMTAQSHPTNWGIVPRAAAELAAHAVAQEPSCKVQLSLSAVEVYNERVRDLFCPAHNNLQIMTDTEGNSCLPGATSILVRNKEHCLQQISEGLMSRAVGSTSMNDASSRSHCLVIIGVETADGCGQNRYSKLCLVDLAGSERQSRTGAYGVTLQEGQNINKSLLVLGSVVHALNGGRSLATRIPYRDSKLTRLLQDSLGGNARTAIVLCCSPAGNDVADTLNTLQFGARAKNIQSRLQRPAHAIQSGSQSKRANLSLAAVEGVVSYPNRQHEHFNKTGPDAQRLSTVFWTATAIIEIMLMATYVAVDYACHN